MIKFKRENEKKFQIFNTQIIKADYDCYITGLIMVKNQERNIVKALKSLNNICDRVIVVDTGSTDKTVLNAQKFSKVEIKKLQWHENYSYMRNETLKFVSSGWILVLDSDETLTPITTYEELHNFLSLLDKNKKVDNIICTTKCRGKGESAFVRKKNLFEASSTLKYHGLVHEELLSTKNANNEIIDTNLEVINAGTSLSEINKFDKLHRYSKLLLKQIKSEPENPRWTAMLSPDYVYKNLISEDWYKAKLQKIIFKNRIDDFSSDNIIKNPYLKYNLSRYLILLGLENKYNLAIDGCKFGETLFPYDANFLSMDILFKNEENNIANYKALQLITNKLNAYEKNMDEVDEESQGSEDAIDELIVYILMKLRHYDQAEDLLKEIKVPIYLANLEPELKLFNISK